MARFDLGVKQLRDDGVDLSTIPDLLGFFFFLMLNLTEERRERLLGTLPDEHFDLRELKRGALKLFHDVVPAGIASGSEQRSWKGKQGWQNYGRRNPRTTFVTETVSSQSWAAHDRGRSCKLRG